MIKKFLEKSEKYLKTKGFIRQSADGPSEAGFNSRSAKQSLAQQGFTLIEMLVVTVILGILLGVSAQVFISILRNQNKTNLVTEIRQESALVIDTFERDVRSAYLIQTFCAAGSGATPPCSLQTSVLNPALPASYTTAGTAAYGVKISYRSKPDVYWLCLNEPAAPTTVNGRFMRGDASSGISLTNTDSVSGVSVVSCTITVDDITNVHLLTLDFQVRPGAQTNTEQANKTDLSTTAVRFTTTVGPRAF